MHPDPRLQAVTQFYDFHPISARQIFDAVAARGIAPGDITEAVLQQHDQDHYGGTDAVDRLMRHAAVRADDHVLDVCSGLGGPARYLAWKTGCQVTGLDLTSSRVDGARALTQAAGLDDRVAFVQGNALAMPFDDAVFTLAVSQEAFAHIPDKPQLIGQCARVLKAGGRLVFTDIMSRAALAEDDARRLYDGMRFSEIATAAAYAHWLQAAGLEVVETVDLTAEWTRILVDRHAMYRSLQAQTVARLGQEHFDRYDQAYAHFVGLYQRGVLAGALIHARRAA
jgi:sarcosine/dimethylglycine N-methyltransferase